MSNIRIRLALPCLLTSLALGLGVQVAGASAMSGTSASTPTVPTISLPGYQAFAPAGPDWTINGSITVPMLICAPHRFAELAPELDGFVNQFDQDVDLGVRLVLRCKNGVASYSPFFLTRAVPAPIPITVSPGDTLNIKITDSSTPLTSYTVTATDGSQTASTSGGGFPLQRIFALSTISCDGAPNPCPPWPGFPQFAAISYSGVTVNGMTLRQLGATGQDGHNAATGFIKTTPLNPAGTGFKLKWKHS